MKRRFLEDTWRREPSFRALCVAFLSCKAIEEMGNFLRDVATLSEMRALSERLECAKLLAQGLSYREVASRTGASTTTVTRVAAFLENGAGGYRKVLKAHRHHRIHPHVMSHGGHTGGGSVHGHRPASALQKYLGRKAG